MTGARICRLLLQRAGVDCQISRGDCNAYHPGDGLITLRPVVYASAMPKAVTLAAHEAGHAVQHRDLGWIAPAINWLLLGRLWLEWDASRRARRMLADIGRVASEEALRESWQAYLVPALWQIGLLLGIVALWIWL